MRVKWSVHVDRKEGDPDMLDGEDDHLERGHEDQGEIGNSELNFTVAKTPEGLARWIPSPRENRNFYTTIKGGVVKYIKLARTYTRVR